MDSIKQFISNHRAISYLILTAIILITCVFAAWSINKYYNDKEYNQAMAEEFDDLMVTAYPIIRSLADATYIKASMLENNALTARDMYPEMDYKTALEALNSRFYRTKQGHLVGVTLIQYDLLISSYTYGVIGSSRDLRKKESLAAWRLYWAYRDLKAPLEISCDSLLTLCQNSKKAITENIEILKKYERPNISPDAWKFPDTRRSMEIHKKYKERKNWPIQFLFKED